MHHKAVSMFSPLGNPSTSVDSAAATKDHTGGVIVISPEGFEFRDWHIPSRMVDGIVNYVEKGIPPGDFLAAVFSNDFIEVVKRADDENMRNLPAYVAWIWMEAPGNCHGSRKIVAEWCARGGVLGLPEPRKT